MIVMVLFPPSVDSYDRIVGNQYLCRPSNINAVHHIELITHIIKHLERNLDRWTLNGSNMNNMHENL